MAFAVVVTRRGIIGDITYVYGTYVNDGGSTGGDIATGLNTVDQLIIQEKGSSISSDRSVVNETMPAADGITIVTSSNESGTWLALGKN